MAAVIGALIERTANHEMAGKYFSCSTFQVPMHARLPDNDSFPALCVSSVFSSQCAVSRLSVPFQLKDDHAESGEACSK